MFSFEGRHFVSLILGMIAVSVISTHVMLGHSVEPILEKQRSTLQELQLSITELQAAQSIAEHLDKINGLCNRFANTNEEVSFENQKKAFELCPSGKSFKITCEFKLGKFPRTMPITTVYNVMYKTAYVDCFSAEVWKEFFNDGHEDDNKEYQ